MVTGKAVGSRSNSETKRFLIKRCGQCGERLRRDTGLRGRAPETCQRTDCELQRRSNRKRQLRDLDRGRKAVTCGGYIRATKGLLAPHRAVVILDAEVKEITRLLSTIEAELQTQESHLDHVTLAAETAVAALHALRSIGRAEPARTADEDHGA